MSDLEHGPLFEILNPPPGGLTRLRTRLRSDRRHRIRNHSLAATAATVMVIGLAALLFPPKGGEPRMLPGLESDLMAIRLGLRDAPSEIVSIRPDLRRDYAVQQVPTTNERVVFYKVGSREPLRSRSTGPFWLK